MAESPSSFPIRKAAMTGCRSFVRRMARGEKVWRILYTQVMHRMVSLGSEYYPMAFYSGLHGGGRLPRFEDPTEGRFLQPGYRIANEVDAVFGGLIAQEQQPIVLGPIPDTWKPAIEAQRDLYYAGLEILTPGRPFAEFMDFVNTFGEKRGLKSL